LLLASYSAIATMSTTTIKTTRKPENLPDILAEILTVLAVGDLMLQDVARLLAASDELLALEKLQQIHNN